MPDFDFAEDIKIDEHALDIEWLEQPRLMLKYAENAADAKREHDLAKLHVDIVRAELDKLIRTDPEDYINGKVVESAIANAILQEDAYQDALALLRDAEYEYNTAQNAVRAFDQRRHALSNLVILHGQQYFAGPSVPRDLSTEYFNHLRKNEKDKAGSEKIARTSRRSRKKGK